MKKKAGILSRYLAKRRRGRLVIWGGHRYDWWYVSSRGEDIRQQHLARFFK